MEQAMNASVYWFMMPPYVRLAIILFIIFIIFRFVLFRLAVLVGNVVLWILLRLVGLLVGLTTSIVGFVVGFRVKKGVTHFPSVHKLEDVMESVVRKLMNARENCSVQHMSRKIIVKRYRRVVLLLIIAVGFSFYKWPDTKLGQTWHEWEHTVLVETFSLSMLSTEEARAVYDQWRQDSNSDSSVETAATSSEDTSIFLQLTSEYDGGKIRRTPSMDGEKIAVIGSGDTLLFLGESEVGSSNVTWYKVETSSGVVGWISSNIVERAE
ncbi:SH3 domain-containing protein [Bacillus sp. HMF5848]|uniref:SH3 domain-containing protein n=1 Tax=Bacillus sp. HMF5848 TaxID=2495421 RepID=UPI000F796989|nr:SH3 domain-containing protein [Bacillus sp. HMF5848]RSK28764.1 SH3 domain-containing protein [Bacillus sp. HMF5848]